MSKNRVFKVKKILVLKKSISFHLGTLLLTEAPWDDLKGKEETELKSLFSIAVAFNAVCGEASLA